MLYCRFRQELAACFIATNTAPDSIADEQELAIVTSCLPSCQRTRQTLVNLRVAYVLKLSVA